MDRIQRLEVQASLLPPRGRRTGVTGAGCEIWIDLGRGVGSRLGWALRLRPWLWDWRKRNERWQVQIRKKDAPAFSKTFISKNDALS